MPSQSPTRAATAGLRSARVKSSSAGSGSARSHPRLTSSTAHQRLAACVCSAEHAQAGLAPPARRSPRRRPPTTGTAGTRGARGAQPDRAGCAGRRPARARSTTTRPPGASSPRTRRSSARGSPPMPMLPSASSARAPAALARAAASKRRGRSAGTPRPGSGRTASRHDVDAEHGCPRSASCAGSSGRGRSRRPGSPPGSGRAARGRRRRPSAPRPRPAAARVPGAGRRRGTARRAAPRRTRRRRSSGAGTAGHRRTSDAAAAPRPRRTGSRSRRRRPRPASATVSTSRSMPGTAHVQPGALRAPPGVARRCAASTSAPRRAPAAAAGSRSASTHQPPSSAGPSTASSGRRSSAAATQQVGGGDLRRVHPDLDHGARPVPPRRGARARAARRRSRPRWANDVPPGQRNGELRATGAPPVEVAGQRQHGTAAPRTPRGTRRRVSSSAAAASSAATAHPDLGAEPGLRPVRAPAPSPPPARRGRSRQHPHRSPGPCARCRAPSRTPSTGCPRHAGGRRRRARRSASRPGWPRRAARPGSRSGGPARRGRAGPARRHTRIGAMSCTGRPIRRRSHHTTSGVADAGVPGPHARAGRPPTADRQVGPAAAYVGRAVAQQVGGVERAVAVHHRDVARCAAASTPACTAAPYPGAGSVTTRAPQPAATSAVSSVEPLSTTITTKSRGHRRQQVGQRGCLVPARQHKVAAGVHGHRR